MYCIHPFGIKTDLLFIYLQINYCLGVNSFKIFMAYSGTFMLQDDEIFQVFTKCRELGAIVMVHAENGSVIKELEKEMSKMGITGPEGHLLSRPEKARDYNTTE
jgi:dihydroorotase-like cyclic amidohydrolase